MSASLVGSEMCIRDRRRGRAWTSARCARARRRASVGAARGRGRCGAAAPVSYTHLTLPTICSV
eukprot:2550311-Alexandrium_andersonii.AAC.1